MSRWRKMSVVVAFASWLAGPLVLLVFGVGSDFAELEKRRARPFPKLAAQLLLDPATYSMLAEYFGDRIPLRAEAVALEARLDLEVFGDSPNPEVLLGKSGWLFHRDSVVGSCQKLGRTGTMVDSIRKLSRVLRASGRRMLFSVAPNKHAIYPERLGMSSDVSRCSREFRQQFRTALEQARLPGYVDLWEGILLLKTQTSENLYWPHDTHWTSRTALEVARLIVARLDPELWDPTAVKTLPAGFATGDLANLFGRANRLRLPTFEISRERNEESPPDQLPRPTPTQSARFLPRVFSIHDSFGIRYIDFVKQYLADSKWTHWRSFGRRSPESAVRAILEADVILVEIVERSLVQRLADSWIDLPARLVGHLADSLPATPVHVEEGEAACDSSTSRATDRRRSFRFDLPELATGSDRFLLVNVVQCPEAATDDRIFVVLEGAAGRRRAKVLEVEAVAETRQLIVEIPKNTTAANIYLRGFGIRSISLFDIDEIM